MSEVKTKHAPSCMIYVCTCEVSAPSLVTGHLHNVSLPKIAKDGSVIRVRKLAAATGEDEEE